MLPIIILPLLLLLTIILPPSADGGGTGRKKGGAVGATGRRRRRRRRRRRGQQQQQQQRPDYSSTSYFTTPPGSLDNPLHQYCGISIEEAHQFCHLPVNESFPCPGGDDDCPYDLPCWALEYPCTMPPATYSPTSAGPTPTVTPSRPSAPPSSSAMPTFRPTTESPITRYSVYPGDHNFCGLGFDNLFDWCVWAFVVVVPFCSFAFFSLFLVTLLPIPIISQPFFL